MIIFRLQESFIFASPVDLLLLLLPLLFALCCHSYSKGANFNIQSIQIYIQFILLHRCCTPYTNIVDECCARKNKKEHKIFDGKQRVSQPYIIKTCFVEMFRFIAITYKILKPTVCKKNLQKIIAFLVLQKNYNRVQISFQKDRHIVKKQYNIRRGSSKRSRLASTFALLAKINYVF